MDSEVNSGENSEMVSGVDSESEVGSGVDSVETESASWVDSGVDSETGSGLDSVLDSDVDLLVKSVEDSERDSGESINEGVSRSDSMTEPVKEPMSATMTDSIEDSANDSIKDSRRDSMAESKAGVENASMIEKLNRVTPKQKNAFPLESFSKIEKTHSHAGESVKKKCFPSWARARFSHSATPLQRECRVQNSISSREVSQ